MKGGPETCPGWWAHKPDHVKQSSVLGPFLRRPFFSPDLVILAYWCILTVSLFLCTYFRYVPSFGLSFIYTEDPVSSEIS
jgi:hypothetical protein